jgi:hypothetical protein
MVFVDVMVPFDLGCKEYFSNSGKIAFIYFAIA